MFVSLVFFRVFVTLFCVFADSCFMLFGPWLSVVIFVDNMTIVFACNVYWGEIPSELT